MPLARFRPLINHSINGSDTVVFYRIAYALGFVISLVLLGQGAGLSGSLRRARQPA
jgi:hypothetical protein